MRKRAGCGQTWCACIPKTRAQGQWLSAGELEQATKGGQYTLHSQSVQALCQKFAVTVTATVTTLRQQELTETGRIQTEYPHHTKSYQTVVWKDDQALQILPDGSLRLPSGGQRPPLLLPLPQEFRAANLRRAKLSWLTWRADHYELCLTLDTGETLPPCELPTLPVSSAEELAATGKVVAEIDLGEVRIAAVTTTRRHALVVSGRMVSGRMLRACTQGRNRQHAILREKRSRCQAGSLRAQRLQQRKAQASAKLYRQPRDILHQAAKNVVDFCAQQGVTYQAVGDMRDLQTGVSLGKATNQKISQWPVLARSCGICARRPPDAGSRSTGSMKRISPRPVARPLIKSSARIPLPSGLMRAGGGMAVSFPFLLASARRENDHAESPRASHLTLATARDIGRKARETVGVSGA